MRRGAVFFASCVYTLCSRIMASRSYLQKDFRRRPVRSKTGNSSRIDEEVEITEVAEEQDDLDDDPLVLKGSRPTGPPKKLPEGAVSIPVP